ncbi:hypothetical protein EU528_02075 [Candidatus Thorarchaeota archaeon]|nr:MAG: hypothetical protein EU528_02075 [Candidatus Thorarchaeota archaeon]
MKLKVLSVVLALVLIYSSIPLTAEAQSHSLEWGVDVDEEFTYVMQRAYFADPSYVQVVSVDLPFVSNMTVGEKYTLKVTELDEIPTLINESSQMPKSTCDLERTNDSLLVGTELLNFVIPIGDWEFINQMTNLTGLEGISLVDTAEEWGSTGVGSFLVGDGSVVTITIDLRFEKENGTLNYLRHRYSTLGTDLIDIIIVNWHPGMPTVVEGSLQTPTILIISIAAVVCFIVSIVVYLGYRSKKPVVQKLGE